MKSIEALNRTILLCRDYLADELSDVEIAQAFQTFRVLCIANDAALSTHSGQTALVTLVSLISRMGMQVGLAVPDVELLRPQPPFASGGIMTALTSASEKLIPGAAIIGADAAFLPDIVFALCAPAIDHGVVPGWQLSATDWSGSINPIDISTTSEWSRDCPIGAMVSALLAANEAFKCVIRRLRLRQERDEVYFERVDKCTWDFGQVVLPRGDLDFGRVDFISAGAITQSTLYALARVPNIRIQARIFDDDATAISNLNRNMLTMIEDVNEDKVDVVGRRCTPMIQLEPRLDRFLRKEGHEIQLAPRVIVGVDDIPSRWAVQSAAPGWVCVGGTSHFSISCSSHGIGQPCSGCLHPIDDPNGQNPIPTISFVSFWAGLAVAVRLIREALNCSYPADRQQLWLTPLRLDHSRAAVWSPVPALEACPVHCRASLAKMVA